LEDTGTIARLQAIGKSLPLEQPTGQGLSRRGIPRPAEGDRAGKFHQPAL
jgi:hypothetical protein